MFAPHNFQGAYQLGHAPFVDTTIDQFQKISKIGKGTYGVVYKAKDLASDKLVALKKILLEVTYMPIFNFYVPYYLLLRKILQCG